MPTRFHVDSTRVAKAFLVKFARLQFLMISKFYQQFQNWLIERCKESKENAQHVLGTLELNIRHLENELFDKIKQRIDG